jgi:hypothetical protein
MDRPELNRENIDSSLASSPTARVRRLLRRKGAARAKCPPPVSKTSTLWRQDWVESHGDYLFNFAVGQMRDANTAEDLVQETFLAALKSQNNFSGRSSERTWLVGILRHKIYDHLRKACRERAYAL